MITKNNEKCTCNEPRTADGKCVSCGGLRETIDAKPTQPPAEGWVTSGARKNLQEFVSKYPHQVTNALDSAYLAGLDDGRSAVSPSIAEAFEKQIEDELVFLHQDGYAGGWVEMKKSAIKDILSTSTKAAREGERKRVVEILEGLMGGEYADFNKQMKNIILSSAIAKITSIDK